MSSISPTRLIIAGIATSLAGIGLGRFAYAALLPGVISQGWLSTADAGYVGAANLLGYLVGAVLASRTERRVGASALIKGSTVLIALSFLLSTWPAPVWWFTLWRFVAGVTGAFLMVAVPALVAAGLPEHLRKRGGTWMFTGIGMGVVLSATAVPTLIGYSLSLAWLALGLLSLIPLVLTWIRWPTPAPASHHAEGAVQSATLLLVFVYLAYLMDAIGFVPHTVFWVDYLEHHRGFSSSGGGAQWAILGVGAFCGPFFAGALARRVGWHRALVTTLLIKGSAVLLPTIFAGLAAVSLSSFLVGAMIPSMVACTAGRIGELLGAARQTAAWGRATALFAVGQAGAAYAMAPIYAHSGSGKLIFEIGGTVLLSGAILVLISPLLAPRSRPLSE